MGDASADGHIDQDVIDAALHAALSVKCGMPYDRLGPESAIEVERDARFIREQFARAGFIVTRSESHG